MTAPTPAVERAAAAAYDHFDAHQWEGTGYAVPLVQEVLTAALTDPDDPDSLARTLFTLTLLARDPGFTVEGAALVWREDFEVTRVHWRAVADGLRMMLTGSGS